MVAPLPGVPRIPRRCRELEQVRGRADQKLEASHTRSAASTPPCGQRSPRWFLRASPAPCGAAKSERERRTRETRNAAHFLESFTQGPDSASRDSRSAVEPKQKPPKAAQHASSARWQCGRRPLYLLCCTASGGSSRLCGALKGGAHEVRRAAGPQRRGPEAVCRCRATATGLCFGWPAPSLRLLGTALGPPSFLAARAQRQLQQARGAAAAQRSATEEARRLRPAFSLLRRGRHADAFRPLPRLRTPAQKAGARVAQSPTCACASCTRRRPCALRARRHCRRAAAATTSAGESRPNGHDDQHQQAGLARPGRDELGIEAASR